MRFRRRPSASRDDKQPLPAVSIHNSDLYALDDELLMGALVAGRGEALSVLYDRYYSCLFWTARRIVGNDEDAEDIVQQVFLETYRARSNFDPKKGTFRAWITRRTYDRARSRYGYLAKHQHYTVEEADENYEAIVANPEKVAIVAELIDKLSPRRQEIIKWRFFQGLTAEETAAQTGYTLSVVTHEFYRALKELRDLADQRDSLRVRESKRQQE